MHRIVVWDPTGELPDGAVVTGNQSVGALRNRGVAALPVDADRAFGAVEGYFRRGWGRGWKYDAMRGERGCPMLLYVKSDRVNIYWLARLIPTGPEPKGLLRLTTDTSKQTAFAGGLSAVEQRAVDVEQLGPPDRRGGWTIGGRTKLSVAAEGYMALNVYGVAQDLAIVWSAVSQSTEDAVVP